MDRASKKGLIKIGTVVFTFGAYLVFLQTPVLADENVVSGSTEVATSEYVSDATAQHATQSTTIASSTETNESTSNSSASANYSVSEAASAVSASSVSNSGAASAVSASAEPAAAAAQSSASAQNTVNVTDLGSVQDSAVIEAAKASAASIYATTGVAQTITATEAASVSQQDVFLASIKQGAIQGWVQYGVLPSVTAAQAILESAWGQSSLSTQGHNLFGIKGSYNGQSVNMKTSEWNGSSYITITAAFRAYPDNATSVVDHGYFLYSNSRYSNIINNRSAV